jgi:hypothetical protein
MLDDELRSVAKILMTDDTDSPRQANVFDGEVRAGTSGDVEIKRLKEEPVTDEDEQTKGARWTELPLKKGAGRMEIVIARAFAEDLGDLLERNPEHFAALRAIVEGRSADATDAHKRDLTKWCYLMPDGSPRDHVKLLVAAAVRDTPEGPVVVDPVDITRPEDAAVLRQAAQEMKKVAKKGWAYLERQVFETGPGDENGQVR